MKKINFNFTFKNIKGEDIENLVPKEEMANCLWFQTSASPAKRIDWAQKIYSEGEIELSETDIAELKAIIVSSERIFDWVKTQLIKSIEI